MENILKGTKVETSISKFISSVCGTDYRLHTSYKNNYIYKVTKLKTTKILKLLSESSLKSFQNNCYIVWCRKYS